MECIDELVLGTIKFGRAEIDGTGIDCRGDLGDDTLCRLGVGSGD
jgi:hypothetical protein